MASENQRDLNIVLDYINERGGHSFADVVTRLEGLILAAEKRIECDELRVEIELPFIDRKRCLALLDKVEAVVEQEVGDPAEEPWVDLSSYPADEDHVDSIHCGCKGCAS